MEPEPIAYIEFADGPMRPIYERDGRQFVIGDDGKPVYGVWFIPVKRATCQSTLRILEAPDPVELFGAAWASPSGRGRPRGRRQAEPSRRS